MSGQTIFVVEQARNCYRKFHGRCIGDSGDVKCFFCPRCVLSLEERVHNLKMFNELVQKEASA